MSSPEHPGGEEQRPRKAKIYTRTGDKGTTSTFAGRRLPKTHVIFNSLGDNDELGSSLGVALQFLHQHQDMEDLRVLGDRLVWIQSRLQELNSHVATPDGTRAESLRFDQDGRLVAQVETWIDAMESTLPPLRTFILPVQMLGCSFHPLYIVWRHGCHPLASFKDDLQTRGALHASSNRVGRRQ